MPILRPLEKGKNALSQYVRRVLKCCERVEDQLTANRLRVTDVELVYTSGFLSIVTKWEAFLEDSLYESACGPVPAALQRRRHLTVPHRAHLERILLHPNRDYITLTNFRQAMDLYGLFLRSSGPVNAVDDSNQTYIQQAIWIRNAIAHSSEAADRAFRNKVPGVTALPKNRRNPGSFLRHKFRVAPDQRRLDLYCGAILSAASQMSSSWSARN